MINIDPNSKDKPMKWKISAIGQTNPIEVIQLLIGLLSIQFIIVSTTLNLESYKYAIKRPAIIAISQRPIEPVASAFTVPLTAVPVSQLSALTRS